MSEYCAAKRRPRGEPPAFMIGGIGFCSGFGSENPAVMWKNSPSCSNSSSVQSFVITRTHSARSVPGSVVMKPPYSRFVLNVPSLSRFGLASAPVKRLSAKDPASVDPDVLAGDEVGAAAREVEDRPEQVLGRARPLER